MKLAEGRGPHLICRSVLLRAERLEWEKNGILRRYLPKRTYMENLVQTKLDEIIDEINKPMACLNCHTPTKYGQLKPANLHQHPHVVLQIRQRSATFNNLDPRVLHF